MKKFILFTLILWSFLSIAQCKINGKNTIKIGDEETYSIDNEAAQCKDCHYWVTIGGLAKIVGDHRQNSVKINATSGGRQIISLSMLTSQGFVQCSKNIDVLDQNKSVAQIPAANSEPVQSNLVPEKEVNCNIGVNNFKEVKTAEQVVTFFPNLSSSEYKYIWSVKYFNGETMQSESVNPQFPFTKENGISTVSIKIIGQKCLKEFTKTYESNYWKFF